MFGRNPFRNEPNSAHTGRIGKLVESEDLHPIASIGTAAKPISPHFVRFAPPPDQTKGTGLYHATEIRRGQIALGVCGRVRQ
jgi:hypothetical protein